MSMTGPPGQWPFGPGVNPVVAPGGWLSGVSNPAGISVAGQQNVPSRTDAVGHVAGPSGNAMAMASGFPSGSDLTRSSNGGPDSSGTAPPPVATKVRKPYTITKVRERWTEEEHERFLAALKLYGRAWRKIEAYIGTKSAVQIRSHAQKFFSKLQRESERANAAGGDGSDSGVTVIPPARPKRKPAHPYPRKAPDPASSGSGAASAAYGNASAFDNAASTVAANLASLGAPGNAAAASFAAALASVAGSSWGQHGNAPAGNPLAGNPFAGAFHPGHSFNPYAVNTVANPLAAVQAALSQAAAANGGAHAQQQLAAQAQAQAQATQQLLATLAALGGAQPTAPALAPQPPTNAQRPVAATPDGNAQGTADLFNAMLAAAAAEGGSDGSGASAAAAGVGGGARSVGSAFTGWTGSAAAQPHAASLAATAAVPGAAMQPTADQLALAMMLYGYAGAPAGIAPKAEEAEPATTRDQRAARSAKEKGKATMMEPEPRDVDGDGDDGSDGDGGGSGGSGGSGGGGSGGSGGSGSGERGSGNSDQTKATRRSDPPKRSSRGFESSSQREASPPERLR